MADSKALSEYYRRTAPSYDKSRFPWQSGPLGRLEFQEISKALKASLLLECGVGSGRFPLVYGRNHFFVGCDINKEMINVCREKLKQANVTVHLIQADAQNLPLSNDVFDSILCSRTFKFFSDPGEYFKEARRCLKEGGMCVTSMPILDSPWFRHAITLGLIKLFSEKDRTQERYYSKNRITKLLQEAGFAKISVAPVGNLLFGLYSFLWFNICNTPLAQWLRYLPPRLIIPVLKIGREKHSSFVLIMAEK